MLRSRTTFPLDELTKVITSYRSLPRVESVFNNGLSKLCEAQVGPESIWTLVNTPDQLPSQAHLRHAKSQSGVLLGLLSSEAASMKLAEAEAIAPQK